MISLVTVFYNGYEKWLASWLDNVLSGEELPDEIVLVASGNYNRPTVRYAEQRLRGRVKYKLVHPMKHKSMGQARNDGVRVAAGPWVMMVGVDDVVCKNAVKDIRGYLCDEFDILIGGMEWLNHPKKAGKRIYDITRESILAGGITNDHSVYRKSLWLRSNYIEYSGDVDMAFWLGLVQAGARIKCIEEVLTSHTFRPDSVFGKYSSEDMREIRRMIKVWQKEGVHSKRFDSPEYKPMGDFGFTHRTDKC